MKQHYIALLLGIIFYLPQSADARICSTMSDGNWNQDEIWSCGAPGPQCGDTIYISHIVQITANVVLDDNPTCINTATFIVIQSGGELNFDSGKKMSLGCGSGVTIEAGGQMTSDGGGASENLKICNTVVWQGSWDADVDGPMVFGSGLPIELISFDAYFNGEKVELTWSTATETNNDFFTVERSQDGISFEKIAILDGAGNSNTLLTYSETDFSPLTGNSYYRLLQTDFNGASTYSKIVAVKSFSLDGEMMIYPNPADNGFNLIISGLDDEVFNVVVRDLAGKEEFSKTFVTSNDNHIESIDPSQKLAAGTYFVTASSRNQIYTQKLAVR